MTCEGSDSTNAAPSPRSYTALLFVPRDASVGCGQPQPDHDGTGSFPQAGYWGLSSLGLVSRRCGQPWLQSILRGFEQRFGCSHFSLTSSRSLQWLC